MRIDYGRNWLALSELAAFRNNINLSLKNVGDALTQEANSAYFTSTACSSETSDSPTRGHLISRAWVMGSRLFAGRGGAGGMPDGKMLGVVSFGTVSLWFGLAPLQSRALSRCHTSPLV